MFIDFLSSCTNVLKEETADYNNAIVHLSRIAVSTGLMPAVTDDLYPIYALACSSANRVVSPNVYFLPIGVHDCWAKPYFEEIVNEFYLRDFVREQFEIVLEEMILLKHPDICESFCLDHHTCYNVLYCHITMPNDSPVYLFILPLDPAGCWKIMERYGIKCDILIDSHKGLGDWFENTPLYRIMTETNHFEVLPRYYFKGLFISHEVPKGFKKIYTIPEPISSCGQRVNDNDKEIYEIDWEESRKH